MKKMFFFLLLCLTISYAEAQQKTYCNPINLDYGYTPIPNFSTWGRHRATADPVITYFKGSYYLFSTNQWGYWWSEDLNQWHFISRRFLKSYHKVYDELCAPAVFVLGDTLLVIGSTYSKNFPIWMSTDPKKDTWKEAIDSFEVGAWDPGFFLDDDGRLYCYFGSSNVYPLYGQQIDRATFKPIGERVPLLHLEPEKWGWHRFGEYMDNTFLDPFLEGAWVNKHAGKYYLQYGAPGTEFSGYADGVAVSDHPLGPFKQQLHNPFSFKPGGFIHGAGHGNSFEDRWKNLWHVSTMVVNVKNNFERRLGLWPAGYDKDGILYCNTAFGDYPHYLPKGVSDHLLSQFTGWMLLNYQKPVTVSSTLSGHAPNLAVDENVKTYWSAQTGNGNEWIQTDLGSRCEVRAIQINYADEDVDSSKLGKQLDQYHQYILWGSNDGKRWSVLVDKRKNKTDVPHDYIELKSAVHTRYIKLQNVHMPTGKFAISGFRVFGKGAGEKPGMVEELIVLRGETDKRSAWIKWKPAKGAWAYNIYTGIAPDKLYNCIMVHDANEYYFKGMDKDQDYYFTIEAINENGVSKRTVVVKQ